LATADRIGSSLSEVGVRDLPLTGATRDLLTLLASKKTVKEAVQLLARRLAERGPVSTRLLYEYVLERPPESRALAMRPIENLERNLLGFIESDEYRFDIARRVMQAFPEFRREFFLHIPKSGGTTIVRAMEATGQYIFLPTRQWVMDGHVSDFNELLSNIAHEVVSKEKNTFSIYGHPTAHDLIAAGIKRFDDHVFSIVRNPNETAYSLLNYIMSKLESATGSECCEADVKLWRKELKVDASFTPRKATNLDQLAQVCFRRVIGRNTLCSALGSDGTAASSLENIFRLGIEIVEFTRLREYLEQRSWNSSLHENRSPRLTAIQSLGDAVRSEIQERISEDTKLYRALQGVPEQVEGEIAVRRLGGRRRLRWPFFKHFQRIKNSKKRGSKIDEHLNQA
jgi:hypothetical protein